LVHSKTVPMAGAPFFRKLSVLCFSGWLVLASGCDYIENPDGDGSQNPFPCLENPPAFTPRTNPVRKVLLEDFTGHRCGNCPRAGETLKALVEANNGRVVGLALHSEFSIPFTVPMNGSKFTYDFRTSIAKAIDETFGVSASGIPKGLVNRIPNNGSIVISHTNWGQLVNNLLATPPDADLQIQANYTPADSSACVFVNARGLNVLPTTTRLVVYLTENNFINWQKDYDASVEDIPDYNHSYILRAPVSSIWGSAIPGSTLASGADTTLGFGIKIDPGKWNPAQLHLVAFLYNDENRQVIQAESLPLLP